MSRIVNAWQVFETLTGSPNANGTIEFFINETTTPQAIFTTPALDVEQTNPYTLDINGAIIGNVWLNPLVTYTYLLKAADTSEIGTVNDVSAGDSSSNTTTTVAIIADLRLVDTDTFQSAFVEGETIIDDGGQGRFYFDATSVLPDNGETIIAPSVGSGRWLILRTGTDSIFTASLNDSAVTTDKINDLSVTTGKIALLAVDTAQLADDAVTSVKINDKSVFDSKLSDMVEAKIKGRSGGSGTGSPENLSAGQVSAILSLGALATLNSVAAGQIDANAVHQSEISTDTDVIALSSFSAGSGDYGEDIETNAGGAYTLGRQQTTGTLPAGMQYWLSDGGGSSTTVMTNQYVASLVVFKDGAGSGTLTATTTTTFIDASPPYNLGHGDMSLFLFLKLDSSGKVISYNTSRTPPWAYNGPTNIVPDRTYQAKDSNGDYVGDIRKYKNVPSKIILPPWQGGDPDEWLETPKTHEVEIDQEMKNRDMGLIPHPFLSLKDGESVVLVDPCSSFIDKLSDKHRKGEDVGQYFKQGHIVLGSEVNCNKPKGVTVMSAKWK